VKQQTAAATRVLLFFPKTNWEGRIMVSEAHAAINTILHRTILDRKPKNSKLLTLKADPNKANHTGTVFGFRDKARMTVGRGIAFRSIESLDDNEGQLTHWTPNPCRYGKNMGGGIVSGFTEDNLLAITTFFIDIDFRNAYARDGYARQHDIGLDTIIDGTIFPTMVLQTDRGYQAYYALRDPAFVKRHKDGRMPVISSAKRISHNLKECLAKRLPQVDLGANDFGIARIPRNDNIVFFEPRITHQFGDLQQWSIQYDHQKRTTKVLSAPKLRVVAGGKQIDQAWFGQVLRCTEICATGKGGGVARHNTALTLALACYQSEMDQTACDNLLDEWNTRLTHPQNPRDVARAVRDAYSGHYAAASPRYIKYISDNWFDGQLTIPPYMWCKFAKPRDERKYSHVEEWAADIMIWSENNIISPDGEQLTVRQLCQELNLSKASLDRALTYLREHNKITVITKMGRNGYTLIQTVANIYAQLVAKRERSRDTYGSGLAFAEWPDQGPVEQPASMAEITRQIDLFFDTIDPPDARRGAG
jgi:hypothetical protein